MRRFPTHAILLSAALTVTCSLAAHAQFGGGRDARRAGKTEDGGSPGMPPVPPSVTALVLEHDKDLSLDDKQRARIESIRSMQDSANRPWMQKLDSLRSVNNDQDDKRKAAQAFMENMRDANADARKQVMDALNPDQQKKVAEYEEDARKKMEDEMRRRRSEGQREGTGGGRGGRGRPPEG